VAPALFTLLFALATALFALFTVASTLFVAWAVVVCAFEAAAKRNSADVRRIKRFIFEVILVSNK
jgi:hypothetical protein